MFDKGVLESLRGSLQQLTPIQIVLLLVSLYISWQVLLVSYRLTLHPLAKYPGPKLAAATYWYEYHYDVSKGGRFIWKIMELHKHYGERECRAGWSIRADARIGPVVRINPNELHFNDPEIYDEIYHGKKYRTNRDKFFNLDYLGEGLAFTIDHDGESSRHPSVLVDRNFLHDWVRFLMRF
jgi:hypothetical protein